MKNYYIVIIALNILFANIISNDRDENFKLLSPELKLEVLTAGNNLDRIMQNLMFFSLTNKTNFALINENRSYITRIIKNKFSVEAIEKYAKSLPNKAIEQNNPNLINILKFMKDFNLLPSYSNYSIIGNIYQTAILKAFEYPSETRLKILNKFFSLHLVEPYEYIAFEPPFRKNNIYQSYPFGLMIRLAADAEESDSNIEKVLDYILKNNPSININQYDILQTNFYYATNVQVPHEEPKHQFVLIYLLKHGANPDLPQAKKEIQENINRYPWPWIEEALKKFGQYHWKNSFEWQNPFRADSY